jgi:hypothetical protein
MASAEGGRERRGGEADEISSIGLRIQVRV